MNDTNGAVPPEIHLWSEVDSEVYCPGRWFALALGTFFLLAGTGGVLFVVAPPGFPLLIARGCCVVFGALGGIILAWAFRSLLWPIHVRHATSDTLPDVPIEPVIREGSIVHGRLTHELVEDQNQWRFRPARNIRRNDNILIFGFGIPFLVAFAGLLTWVFHSQHNVAGWFLSALFATAVTLVCGGTAFALIGLMIRSNHRRLCHLSIPVSGADLELDSPEELDPEKLDLATGLNWIFLGDNKRRQLTIPRELVAAVQLCPWKFATQSDVTWAVQGLLVLKRSTEGVYHRLPVLLTSDFVGAAKLMRELANTLGVPFLFCADEDGWAAEKRNAKTRPSLKIGGMVT